MKTIRLINSITLSVILLALSSCLGDGTTTITTDRAIPATSNMSYITNTETGNEYIIGTGADYSFHFESVSQKMNVGVTGLQLLPGAGSYTFNLNDVSFEYDSFGAIVAKIPTYTDAKYNVTISDFELNYYQRMMGQLSIPVWTLTYTVDNRFRIRVIQNAFYYFGTTKMTDLSTTQEIIDSETIYYAITFDPKTLDGKELDARINVLNITLPTEKFVDNYIIEQNLKAVISADGYQINGTNCKLIISGSNKQTENVINSASAKGTFLLKDDGQKRNPNVEINFTMDNRYRLEATAGLSFTSGLIGLPQE